MFAVEILRLYLGYEGNLREKVCPFGCLWLLCLDVHGSAQARSMREKACIAIPCPPLSPLLAAFVVHAGSGRVRDYGGTMHSLFCH